MPDSTRIALVTNAQSYAGPAATATLLKQGFGVVAHDAAFTDAPTREEYAAANPGAKPSLAREPRSSGQPSLGPIRPTGRHRQQRQLPCHPPAH